MKHLILVAVAGLLAGCGGGGSGSDGAAIAPVTVTAATAYNYTPLNGNYTCKIASTGEAEIFSATFSATKLHVFKVDGTTGDVTDIIGFVNGYPRYSQKLAGTDEAVTFFFTTDGLLSYGRGKVTGIESLSLNALQVALCKKS